MLKLVSCNVFAIITIVKYCENPHEVSTAARENPCETNAASKLSRKLRESWTLRINNEQGIFLVKFTKFFQASV